MGNIGKPSGVRLQPLAVLTLDPCGHAPASRRYAHSFLRPMPRQSSAGGIFRRVSSRRAHASAARNRPGVTPISRRKMELRWLWSANPASCAIRERGCRVRRSRVLARSNRRWMT